jgi:hypothetical protein
MLSLVRAPGIASFLAISLYFAGFASLSVAEQDELPVGQSRSQVKDEGVMETYDRGRVIDKVDIPGRVLASKQIIKLSEDLVSKPKLRHLPSGPDYVMNIEVDERIQIEGILIGVKGQSRKGSNPQHHLDRLPFRCSQRHRFRMQDLDASVHPFESFYREHRYRQHTVDRIRIEHPALHH